MSNRFRALLLLMIMAWQTLSWATPLQINERVQHMAHAIVHTQEVGHHHHADESLHLDENTESASHYHVNQGVQPPALEPYFAWQPADPPSLTPLRFLDTDFTSVTPDGLLRPPRR